MTFSPLHLQNEYKNVRNVGKGEGKITEVFVV